MVPAPVTSRARLLSIAKQVCRSVTPTAPRASMTLNTCDSFRRWSYAGTGRRFASSRRASCSKAAKPHANTTLMEPRANGGPTGYQARVATLVPACPTEHEMSAYDLQKTPTRDVY